MNNDKIFKLVDRIREHSFSLHCYLKNGFLEKVYENGLTNRLRKDKINVVQQSKIKVYDEDKTIIGDYIADLLVEKNILVELKAVKNLDDTHLAQLFAYLKATKIKHGMLINFGSPKIQIKKIIL